MDLSDDASFDEDDPYANALALTPTQLADKRKAGAADGSVVDVSASPGFDSSSPLLGVDGYPVTEAQCDTQLANFDKRRRLASLGGLDGSQHVSVFRVPSAEEAPS